MTACIAHNKAPMPVNHPGPRLLFTDMGARAMHLRSVQKLSFQRKENSENLSLEGKERANFFLGRKIAGSELQYSQSELMICSSN